MSNMAQPQQLYPSGVSNPIVGDAYDKWSAIALQAFAKAQQLADQIADIQMSPVAFNAHFDPQIALAAFPTLPKPTVPDGLAYTPPALPGAPPTISVPVLPPIEYLSDLLGTIKGTLTTLLAGNPLPAGVARALRDRGYSEANAEETRAIAQAYDELASRGHEEPAGMVNRRVAEARQDARNKRQQINRDIYIQEQTVAIENLRFALNAGIQLEGMQVTVFRAQADVELETVRIAAETNRLKLDGWRAQVELYDTELKGELARLDAVLRQFQASVQVYAADAQVATAAGDYNNRRFQLNLAQEQAQVDTEMKRQDQNFEQMRYITSVMLEIKKTLATVGSQLAASAMSAVNISAGLSASYSEHIGYSMGLSYSGSLPDTSI